MTRYLALLLLTLVKTGLGAQSLPPASSAADTNRAFADHRVRRCLAAQRIVWQTDSAVPTPEREHQTDYAESKYVDAWLQHPVLGGPSFDSFERGASNPIWQGMPPLEWPVNAFLFQDPVGGEHYAYIGAYPEGYIRSSSRCVALRSGDGGRTWDSLGTVIRPSLTSFDKGGHTPDVSVVYEAGRYHMVYDWGELDFNREGGLAYAWADRPEGPWHRAAEPLTRNSQLPLQLGRYRRTYAATLIRRKNDWLITGMMDDAPRSWALFVMTAPRPEGPYTERKLVRHVLDGYFHPPLMEFFPSFVHRDTLYAPATSVALNRNVNALFAVPMARATDLAAWRVKQFGSLWHSADVPAEYEGLWGQTFAGQVDSTGTLRVLFPSRTVANRGTVGFAQRPWDHPFRTRGFVLNAHAGPTLALLRKAFGTFRVETRFALRGTARLLLNYAGLLGPDRTTADAAIGRSAKQSHQALELTDSTWAFVAFDNQGTRHNLGSGKRTRTGDQTVSMARDADGTLDIALNGSTLWRGRIAASLAQEQQGVLGWWLEPRAYLTVEQFLLTGQEKPASLFFDATDALLGAGQDRTQWQAQTGGFRSDPGFKSEKIEAKAKWNVPGRQFRLWSPTGPGLGTVTVLIDGKKAGAVNLSKPASQPSAPVWTSERLSPGYHAVMLIKQSSSLTVDCLEAQQ